MGGSFSECPLFKEARGGVHPSFSIFFFPAKVAKLANIKCQIGSRIIGSSVREIESIRLRGGWKGLIMRGVKQSEFCLHYNEVNPFKINPV